MKLNRRLITDKMQRAVSTSAKAMKGGSEGSRKSGKIFYTGGNEACKGCLPTNPSVVSSSETPSKELCGSAVAK